MEGGIFVNIHESAEDYLEAILKLLEDHGMVRSIDIVHELGFSKPSVSIAMRSLRENRPTKADLMGPFFYGVSVWFQQIHHVFSWKNKKRRSVNSFRTDGSTLNTDAQNRSALFETVLPQV